MDEDAGEGSARAETRVNGEGALHDAGRPHCVVRGLAFYFSADERFEAFAACLVLHLDGWGLHEVGGCGQDWATNTAVFGDLRCADGVNDDSCGVGGVPDFEFVFEVEGNFTECASFEADVSPLAVIEPGDVVGGADVNVAVFLFPAQWSGEVGGDGLGFEIFLDSRRSRSSMFLKSMFPPTLSW